MDVFYIIRMAIAIISIPSVNNIWIFTHLLSTPIVLLLYCYFPALTGCFPLSARWLSSRKNRRLLLCHFIAAKHPL